MWVRSASGVFRELNFVSMAVQNVNLERSVTTRRETSCISTVMMLDFHNACPAVYFWRLRLLPVFCVRTFCVATTPWKPFKCTTHPFHLENTFFWIFPKHFFQTTHSLIHVPTWGESSLWSTGVKHDLYPCERVDSWRSCKNLDSVKQQLHFPFEDLCLRRWDFSELLWNIAWSHTEQTNGLQPNKNKKF